MTSAPVDATATSESTSAFKVSFPAPGAGSAVQAYQAGIKDGPQTCNVLVNASLLECQLTNLNDGTQYAILVTASVESVQSDASEISGYTLPEGNQFYLENGFTIDFSTSCYCFLLRDFKSSQKNYMQSTSWQDTGNGARYNNGRIMYSSWYFTKGLREEIIKAGHFFTYIYIKLNTFYLAPFKVEVVWLTTTTVTARATTPSGNPAIDAYEANVVGGTSSQKCTAMQSVQPHQCEVIGLSPNTAYTVSMRASLPGSSGCGMAITVDSRTLPNRMLNDL